MDVMFQIPDIKGKKQFTVTKSMVLGEEKDLGKLIKQVGGAIEIA